MKTAKQYGTTAECLRGQPEIKQINAALDRGITRNTKRENRAKKRAQHLQNLAARASK